MENELAGKRFTGLLRSAIRKRLYLSFNPRLKKRDHSPPDLLFLSDTPVGAAPAQPSGFVAHLVCLSGLQHRSGGSIFRDALPDAHPGISGSG